MKVAEALMVAVLLLAVALATPDGQDTLGAVNPHGTHLEESDTKHLEERRKEGRIFALSTTTSIKRVATTTITAISTCVSTLAAGTACIGRRKRSPPFPNALNLDALEDIVLQNLDGSQVEAEELASSVSAADRVERAVADPRDGRKLTIWSSFISTLTLTSTSYLAGTTITASALCAGPGIANGCFGK